MTSLYDHPIYRPANSALPVWLFWTCAFAVLAFVELEGWAPRWLLLLLMAPAAVLALLHYHNSFLRLSWAVKTYGGHLPSLMRRMINLFPKLARSRAETTKALIQLALAILGFTVAVRFGIYSVLAMTALLVGIFVTVLLRALLPPGGVYLASSNPERIGFFGQLSVRTIPAFAALLEVSNLLAPEDGFGKFFSRAVGVLNDYRTTDPNEWTTVVRNLIEMTAVVVVDGRDQTPGLQFEVERILRNRLEFKTAFLSADGGMPPVLTHLNAKSSHPSGTFLLMSPEDALQTVPIIIRDAKAFWIPVRMDA